MKGNGVLTIKPLNLPDTGLLKLKTVLRFIEVSPADWWDGVKKGIYPQSYKIPQNKTRWRAEDIRKFIDSINPSQN